MQALVRELQKKQLALELRNEELKQAHQQAEASRRRFTHLYDFAPVGYFTMNPLGTIIEVNQAGTLLLGEAKETLINRRLQSCLAPEAGPIFNDFLQRIFAQRKRLRCELALLNNNGARVEVQIEGLVLRGETDGLEQCLATIVDITEQKWSENLIRQSEERLILELRDALKKVRTLSGLLPICSKCKKIRDDHGYWSQVEIYVMKHSDAQFTDGLCPECITVLFPDDAG